MYIDNAGCKGVPDMVVEILSPTTSDYDRITTSLMFIKTKKQPPFIFSRAALLIFPRFLPSK